MNRRVTAHGNLLAEANASNVITRYYIYGNGLTALVDAATNALYVYHHDGTGHTVALTNAAQQTVNTYAYDLYGRLMAQTETIAQPFKYAGQVGVFAEGNNFYYMRARYYDANIGRFISEDPIGFAGGLNLYAYVGGNPVMAVDPSGMITDGEMRALRQVVNKYGFTSALGWPVTEHNFKADPTMDGHLGETNWIGTSRIGTNPSDSLQYAGSVIASGKSEDAINTALHENFHSFEGLISVGILNGYDSLLEKFTGGERSVAQHFADSVMERNHNIVGEFEGLAKSYTSTRPGK